MPLRFLLLLLCFKTLCSHLGASGPFKSAPLSGGRVALLAAGCQNVSVHCAAHRSVAGAYPGLCRRSPAALDLTPLAAWYCSVPETAGLHSHSHGQLLCHQSPALAVPAPIRMQLRFLHGALCEVRHGMPSDLGPTVCSARQAGSSKGVQASASRHPNQVTDGALKSSSRCCVGAAVRETHLAASACTGASPAQTARRGQPPAAGRLPCAAGPGQHALRPPHGAGPAPAAPSLAARVAQATCAAEQGGPVHTTLCRSAACRVYQPGRRCTLNPKPIDQPRRRGAAAGRAHR